LRVYATRENLDYGVDYLRSSYAEPVNKATFYPSFRQKAGHLLPASMNHNDLAFCGGRGYLTCQTLPRIEIIEEGATQLNKDSHAPSKKTSGLGESQDEIEILDSLSGRSFYQIVDNGNHHGTPRARVILDP
jgi:hypothetical protein